MLTYEELLVALKELTPEQLKANVSIYQDGEVIPVKELLLAYMLPGVEDILDDENHPLLFVGEDEVA